MMAKEHKHIGITHRPELLQIVPEAQRANEPLVLREANKDVAIVRPIKRAQRKPIPRGRPTSADDPLWNIVGIARGPDDGVRDVSTNKHKYLADAYADLHE